MSPSQESMFEPLTPHPTDFSNRAFRSQEEKVDAIKDWFFSNFEDPGESTPYNGEEGGYQYIYGGPYDAQEVIEQTFYQFAPTSLIEEAVKEIEREGIEWVRRSSQLLTPDDASIRLEETSSLSMSYHEQMILRVKALDTEVDVLKRKIEYMNKNRRMGHNNPPNSIDIDDEIVWAFGEISNASDILKTQPVNPVDKGEDAKEAVGRLKKVLIWLADKVAPAVIIELAKKLPWHTLGQKLEDVCVFASKWIDSLSS